MAHDRRGGGVEDEARHLVEALGGRWAAGGGTCRCPAHDDRTPSLSIRPGRKRLLLHCFAGCTAAEVLRALGSRGMLDPASANGPGHADHSRPDDRMGAARRIWDEARAIGGTPAEAYLQRRGLVSSSAALRFHPRAPAGRHPLAAFRPALIAAVRDDAGLMGIQRIFLEPGIKGGRKLCLGRLGGGAVRLAGSGPTLGLAEGVETALAASRLFAVPCWAALGAERFGRVVVPAEVRELCLFLDHDAGGERADALARRAFAHLQIRSFRPNRPGDDWNDVLLRG